MPDLDLQGLPSELLDQLSISREAAVHHRLAALIPAGKVLNLDEILIKYYHSSGKVLKRRTCSGYISKCVREGKLVKDGDGWRRPN